MNELNFFFHWRKEERLEIQENSPNIPYSLNNSTMHSTTTYTLKLPACSESTGESMSVIRLRGEEERLDPNADSGDEDRGCR